MSDKEAFDKIRDIALDYMSGTEADYIKAEGFYLQDGYSEPPCLNLYDASGKSIPHPACEGVKVWERIDTYDEPEADGKAASDLTPAYTSEDGEEHYLNLRAPFSVIEAIEQMRALMAEQGQPWERITYHIKPGKIDYEWQ